MIAGMDDKTPRRTRRRGPEPATARRLEQAALNYLERFASSSANLQRVLLRRVERAVRAHGGDRREGERLVAAIVARYVAASLLDDQSHAAQQAASLRRRGASRYAIRGRLARRGVDAALSAAALARVDTDAGDGELAAACAFVRRRRLGPLRPPAARAAHRQKDLAALARAGFALALARRVLAAEDDAALAALERGEEARD